MRRLRLPSLVAIAAGVLLAITGCDKGEDDAAAAEPPAIDACELVTMDDARAVLGIGAGQMTSFAEDELGRDPGYCAYSSGGTPPDVLSIQVRRHRSPERAESALRSVRSALRAEPVEGLGDGACFGMGQLHVRQGATQITITVQAPQVDNPYAAARGLAEKALGRLETATRASS